MGRIGFTGTQRGMTGYQMAALRSFFDGEEGSEFHHGDCIGADAEAHDIAVARGLSPVIHPPENSSKRAWKTAAIVWEPEPYLERNHYIADACDILIACPGEKDEQLRSGTWATVRYARKLGKRVLVLYPDGGGMYTPVVERSAASALKPGVPASGS